jgi:glycosyltransferase 2 family protein
MLNRKKASSPVVGWIIKIAKFALSFAILGYLFNEAYTNQQFSKITQAEKNWGLLAGGFGLTLLYFLISFVRWWLLVRALKLPLSLFDAVRFGFISLLFTFLTLGVVGGDAVKAIYAARLTPGRRAEAIGSVLVDRIIGLFSLFVVVSVAFLFSTEMVSSDESSQWAAIKTACWISVGFTILGVVGYLAIGLTPRLSSLRISKRIEELRWVGGIWRQILASLDTYRSRFDVVCTTVFMSIVIHVLMTLAVYCTAAGLTNPPPSFLSHFISVPIANFANLIPLPGGLGAFEGALDFMYVGLSHGEIDAGFGLIVALCYRVIILLVAMFGVYFYLSSRREVDRLMEETQNDEVESS